MKPASDYVTDHSLLRGKFVRVTASASIGFAIAQRAAEEGCRALFIHEICSQ